MAKAADSLANWRALDARLGPDVLRIASYNIHRCVGSDRNMDASRVARVIAELNCDTIGLQEVDNRPEGGHDSMQLDFIAALGRDAPQVAAEERAEGVIDPGVWEEAVADRSLWGEWGAPLLESYEALRHRHGPDLAARAFRRALESAAPGVPWMAPPTPPSPFEPLPETAAETLFEKRREVHL